MKRKVSNVKLPRGIFHSIHNETDYVKVAVMVIDVGQVGLFKVRVAITIRAEVHWIWIPYPSCTEQSLNLQGMANPLSCTSLSRWC